MSLQKERNRRFEKESKKQYCLFCGMMILVLWLILLLVGYFCVDKDKHTILYVVYLAFRIYFIVINAVTFIINCVDKMLAKCECEQHRVPELMLHICTGLGGAPATALAIVLPKHKSSKASYHDTFLKTSGVHICLFFICAVILSVLTAKFINSGN